jgi:hypothetical protein
MRAHPPLGAPPQRRRRAPALFYYFPNRYVLVVVNKRVNACIVKSYVNGLRENLVC